MPEDEKKMVECPECGAKFVVVGEDEDGWLECIPFTGPEAGLLVGSTRMRNGAVMYIGPASEKYTREKAIEKFGQAEVDFQDEKAKKVEPVKLGKY